MFGCSDDKKNDLTRNNLNGNVKSTYQVHFEAVEKFGKITKGSKIKTDELTIWLNEVFKEYDDNGNTIEFNRYNSDGELEYKYTFEYDYKGNMIEMNWLRGTLTYEYDDKGNINEENYYNSDGELEDKKTYEYKFDDKENWIQQIIFEDDKPTFIVEREIKYYD